MLLILSLLELISKEHSVSLLNYVDVAATKNSPNFLSSMFSLEKNPRSRKVFESEKKL